MILYFPTSTNDRIMVALLALISSVIIIDVLLGAFSHFFKLLYLWSTESCFVPLNMSTLQTTCCRQIQAGFLLLLLSSIPYNVGLKYSSANINIRLSLKKTVSATDCINSCIKVSAWNTISCLKFYFTGKLIITPYDQYS
jgi:hypothetical protein